MMGAGSIQLSFHGCPLRFGILMASCLLTLRRGLCSDTTQLRRAWNTVASTTMFFLENGGLKTLRNDCQFSSWETHRSLNDHGNDMTCLCLFLFSGGKTKNSSAWQSSQRLGNQPDTAAWHFSVWLEPSSRTTEAEAAKMSGADIEHWRLYQAPLICEWEAIMNDNHSPT